ncbi:MAG: hypothetical protein ACI4UL_03480 [Muribaculaceae bacterium]
MEHLEDAKTPANQVISLLSEAFYPLSITVGYAALTHGYKHSAESRAPCFLQKPLRFI